MNKPKFVYSVGYRAKVSADIAGEELLRIAGDRGIDGLSSREIVEAAREKESPIHRAFEWDNKTAGEQYRLQQARDLIGALRILVTYDDREPILHRVFVNLEDGQGYRSSIAVEKNAETRSRLLGLVISDLRQAERRLTELRGFSGIVKEIAAIENRLRKAVAKVA